MRSFTLIEIIVTVIIIGILAALGLATYGGYKENALDKEAQVNLRLIIAAERIYRIEAGAYGAAPDNTTLNDSFRLLLPMTSPNWNYKATVGGASPTCAQATRNSASNVRYWRMRITEDDPKNTAGNNTCP